MAQGRLVRVLPQFVDLRPSPVYAVTASTRQRLPKIKACIDFWAEWFDELAANVAAAPTAARS